jgi:hypothetical protein
LHAPIVIVIVIVIAFAYAIAYVTPGQAGNDGRSAEK